MTINKKTIKIRLQKGLMRCTTSQRSTVVGLGIKRRQQVVVLENTPAVRGMIKKVIHLLEIINES